VVAFAASGQPASVWLLLRDCLALAPAERLRSAEQGLTLCERLRSGHPTDAALAKLVRSFQSGGSPWQPPDALLPQLYRFEPTVDLADRLRQSFAAEQVEVLSVASSESALSGEDSAIDETESRFVERALQGKGRPRPADAVLRQAMQRGNRDQHQRAGLSSRAAGWERRTSGRARSRGGARLFGLCARAAAKHRGLNRTEEEAHRVRPLYMRGVLQQRKPVE
jgi:hypothetical protein